RHEPARSLGAQCAGLGAMGPRPPARQLLADDPLPDCRAANSAAARRAPPPLRRGAALPPSGDAGAPRRRARQPAPARPGGAARGDSPRTLVGLAREAAPGLDVSVTDAGALPFAAGTFDLVVAFMSLHDFTALPAAVSEAARCLERGGRLCLAIVHPINSAG